MREYVVENEFVKAVRKAGGVAYKLTSQTANGLPDRLVLFFPAKYNGPLVKTTLEEIIVNTF